MGRAVGARPVVRGPGCGQGDGRCDMGRFVGVCTIGQPEIMTFDRQLEGARHPSEGRCAERSVSSAHVFCSTSHRRRVRSPFDFASSPTFFGVYEDASALEVLAWQTASRSDLRARPDEYTPTRPLWHAIPKKKKPTPVGRDHRPRRRLVITGLRTIRR